MLDKSEVYSIEPIETGTANATIGDIGENTLLSTCNMSGSVEQDFCGVLINLTQDRTQGLDLREYDKLQLKFTLEAPHDTSHIKIFFRTYNQNYAVVGDDQSYKYNSLFAVPQSTSKINEEYLIDDEVGASLFEDIQKILSNTSNTTQSNTTFLFNETVPLSYLRVEDWWITENNISPE